MEKTVVNDVLTASSKLFGKYSSKMAALVLNHINYYHYQSIMTRNKKEQKLALKVKVYTHLSSFRKL